MSNRTTSETALKRLGFVLGLTRLGLLAETLTRAFWPVWTILFACAAAVMMGALDVLPFEISWAAGFLAVLASCWFAAVGIRQMRWPSREDAISRLDATLPGRPIQALRDDPAIGRKDDGSQAIWQAHQDRMAQRTAEARAIAPDLRLSRFDPFGLRYIATLLLLIGLLFGSVARVGDIKELASGDAASGLAAGPTWEGWIEPPAYTGKPTLYLNDQPIGDLEIAEGSTILLRLYGEVGALTVAETVSGRVGEIPSAAEPEQSFVATQDGTLEIGGAGDAKWRVILTKDRAPEVAITGQADTSARGEMTLPFEVFDDYEVVGGTARIELDLAHVDRRYGLTAEPDSREPIDVPLPLPIAGDRSAFEETLIEDFSQHVWAHLPVTVTLTAQDAAGQEGQSITLPIDLPARGFFDPLAAAVIEMRRDLLWSKENAPRVAQVMRALSHNPVDGIFKRETDYLRTRAILRRLEAFNAYGLSDEKRDELADALWELALNLEDGNLGNALERLQQAQDRLAEAMKNGASDSEIERLMQELREATEDYMRELARRNQQEGEQSGDQQQAQNSMQMDQDDLQRMMDRIQELMEQGRMAEAQQALEELQRMLENMQVTQGPSQSGEGDQAMQGLSDTLREQQGLSDEAFRELQEQFNPNAQAGQSGENEGFSGGEGRGTAHDGTGGEGQGEGEAEGEGQANSGQSGQQGGESEDMGLGDRQQALRQELDRQMRNLPGGGSPEGDDARESLGRAGEAMDGAEEALRQDDLATAIDRQAEAMDALRDGMRSLGEALAQEQQGSQGNTQAQGENRDPLGRSQGNRGAAGTDDGLLQGEDVYRQARRLLDEIRRRAGEAERPEVERNYLERLLDRF
ncbi:TIGR02302 family protein [Shimia haliotis]|uniref:TIGR02302 family protein n=1 Tax=Shimia haliotis TaxID=1280847 RepID=A0A1I4CUU9_9RHOB|nr:TIGR02302 family protein [Shimia haliotis]SFK83796.1 TIGR02302 family protein [Shimia haliotis]